MNEFFKKYSAPLKLMALLLMLIIPFFLFQGAIADSVFQVNLFLGLMMANMLFVMTKG